LGSFGSGLREGWGLNIVEANALGVPAVAYDVPGYAIVLEIMKQGADGRRQHQGPCRKNPQNIDR